MQDNENERKYDAGSPQTDAIWFGSEQPRPYRAGQQWANPGQQDQQQAGGGLPWSTARGGTSPWGGSPEPRRGRAWRLMSFALVAILGIGIGAAAAFGLTRGTQPNGSNPGAGAVPTPGSQRPPLQNTG